MRQAIVEHSRDEFREDVWERLAESLCYVAADFGDRGRRAAADRLPRRPRRDARHRRQPRLLPRRPAEGRSADRHRAGPAARSAGWTRLIVEKPFGHDLRERPPAERPRPRVLRRRRRSTASTTTWARRPSRTCSSCASPTASSSRSGTASSSTTSRSRWPSRSGVEGRGELLRRDGRDARRRPEPHAPARRADGDGAADRLRGRGGAEREGQGAAGAAHARAEARRPRPVRPRVHRGRAGARLPRGGRRRAGLRDRDLRRRQALRRQLALGGHAVLHPHRQAAAAPRDDDRDPVQARAAPALRGGRRGGLAAERAPHPHPAGRGRLARGGRQGARGRASPSAPCTWTSSTAAPSASACRRPTSA